ncbi:hypothetical protein [Frigoriflavimonas asaccharolytica]|uniref:LysM domain-containing protein n=1 Tax=Frigoriflavimonas asaccharolytica TaxID=2735899 RepID=A0A8J8GAB3_9FLAO|nr:hypothetical protein [Frigoriflavimonas asaccharolytica]NRS94106.1 hypothetical protein [Frigoriflavimonas asaccharolytica]
MTNEDNNYIKLKIEGIFKLKKVASEFNITSDDLVAFHNQFCDISELLPLNMPKHVEHVYLPAQNFKDRDVKLLKSTKLALPTVVSEKTYGVMLNFLPKDLKMHYKIKVKKENGFLEISKEKTYINNKEIEQTIEQLFEKAEQVLYPIQIATDEKGAIFKIINNEGIANHWEKDCKPMLVEYYKSETADNIIGKLDKSFKNLSSKKDLLERNLFYKLFFLPVYTNYPDFFKKDFLKIYFSGIKNVVNYTVEYSLEKEFTRGQKIALRISGKEEGNIFNKNSEKGEIDLLYKFHKESNAIFSITGFATAVENGIPHKIDFQLYELENNS